MLWSIRCPVVPMPEVWNHKWKVKLLPTHSTPPSASSLGADSEVPCTLSLPHPRLCLARVGLTPLSP